MDCYKNVAVQQYKGLYFQSKKINYNTVHQNNEFGLSFHFPKILYYVFINLQDKNKSFELHSQQVKEWGHQNLD